MKIEKIFSIRVFDGKKAIRERILAFSRAVIAKADLKTLLGYDARTFAASLDKSTIILLMLESEAAHAFLELNLKITTGKTCQQIPSPPEPDLQQYQK